MAAASSLAGPHAVSDSSGTLHLELWQVINLLGTPMLAIMFAKPVIDDVRAWLRGPDEG